MNTVLVWVMILVSHQGGITKVENIANFEDCERLRERTEWAVRQTRSDSWQYAKGSCTQVAILVPKQPDVKPPTITVKPSIIVQPTPIKNTVIIRKNAP